ncbi:MAG: TrkA family potassium uptake protein [Clostridiales bacterium]|nr:TrkA family potassium uptake protein [Clostridiales bacterium]
MYIKKKKSAIIIGSGRFGSSLASILYDDNYDVVIVDRDPGAFSNLSEKFSGYQVNLDAYDIISLERVGLKRVQTFVACTGNDNFNSMLCQIARKIYNTEHVYMRMNNPENEVLLEGLNINVIYPFKLSVTEFERLRLKVEGSENK